MSWLLFVQYLLESVQNNTEVVRHSIQYKMMSMVCLFFHQQIEGAGQQLSKRTFFKVLERLREWEICSPDICAAIEFCREKIVEMTVEDFEEWFSQQFPKIQRPQTAPVGKKKSRGGENLQVALQERFPSAYSSRAKSGFRPRGQRSKSGYAFSGRPLSSSTTVTVANPVIKVRPMSMR